MWNGLKFNNLGVFCDHKNENCLKALGASDRNTI